jgi:hypothetical protein
MNFEKCDIEEFENETIININLNHNENIIFHKREKNHIKIGDKICSIENSNQKNQIFSPINGTIQKISSCEIKKYIIVLKTCLHEIEFNGMCAECGIDLRYFYV